MIEQTVYINVESDSKRVTLPKWAYEYLKAGDLETMTKGLKAYEALLFENDEYTDSLSKIEDSVNSRLSSVGSSTLVTSISKIKNNYEVLDYSNDVKMEKVNVHLPISLFNQFQFNRYLGKRISEAVEEIAQSVYTDRMDRIQVKQQIADYIEHRSKPTHEIAQAIVEGENEKFQEAHKQLKKHTRGEVEGEKLQVRDDLTIAELKEIKHNEHGKGWSQKEGEKRREGFRIAVKNKIQEDNVDEYEYDKEKLVNLAREIFDVGEATAQNYVDDIDIDWISTINFQHRRSIREIKEEYKASLLDKGKDKTKKNKIDRVSLNEFVLLDMKIPEGDENVPVPVAKNWIEEIKSSKSDPLMKSKIGQIQKNARKDFLAICDSKIDIIEKYKK